MSRAGPDGQWLLACLFAALFLGAVASLLGPFRLEAQERPSRLGTSAWASQWARGWWKRPRDTLTTADWNPNGGRMFLPAFAALGLTYGGVWVLVGRGETFRPGGALALVGGLLLWVLIIGYLRRPKWPSTVGERFQMSRPGYQAGEVDAFFAGIGERSLSDIEGAQFHIAPAGYDVDVVDDALATQAKQLRSRS